MSLSLPLLLTLCAALVVRGQSTADDASYKQITVQYYKCACGVSALALTLRHVRDDCDAIVSLIAVNCRRLIAKHREYVTCAHAHTAIVCA